MYLIHEATKTFWQITTAHLKTEVSYGFIGSNGRLLVKQHATPADARAYSLKYIVSKKGIGYVEGTPIRRSKRVSSKRKKTPVAKTKKKSIKRNYTTRQQANKKKALKIKSAIAKRKRVSDSKRKEKTSRALRKHTNTNLSKRTRNLSRKNVSAKKLSNKERKRVSSRKNSSSNKRKRSVSKYRKSIKSNKPSTKRRKKTSTAVKSKKKSASNRAVARKRTKSVTGNNSSSQKMKTSLKKKKNINRNPKTISTEQQVSTGKPSADEHSGLGKFAEVWIEKNIVYDTMLNLRDPEKNIDKFYVLQVLITPTDFLVFTRWGRTGTIGQIKIIIHRRDHKSAVKQFEEKFMEKTGIAWEIRESLLGKSNPNKKKYSILRIKYISPSKRVTWQYFMDDGVDGKSDGWWDYSKSGSAEVEKVWQQHQANTSANLGIRHVKSGYFMYEVDFRKMKQTNVAHPARKCRRIRQFIK